MTDNRMTDWRTDLEAVIAQGMCMATPPCSDCRDAAEAVMVVLELRELDSYADVVEYDEGSPIVVFGCLETESDGT